MNTLCWSKSLDSNSKNEVAVIDDEHQRKYEIRRMNQSICVVCSGNVVTSDLAALGYHLFFFFFFLDVWIKIFTNKIQIIFET